MLPTDDVTIIGRAMQVMKDLTPSTFCVPLEENNSPIAFSISSDIHWNHPITRQCGILRYVMQQIYIIEGRSV